MNDLVVSRFAHEEIATAPSHCTDFYVRKRREFLKRFWIKQPWCRLVQYWRLPPRYHVRQDTEHRPAGVAGHVWLAATYVQLGNFAEATVEAAEVLRIEPKWTIEGPQVPLSAFNRTQDAEHYFDGMRKAGLPER